MGMVAVAAVITLLVAVWLGRGPSQSQSYIAKAGDQQEIQLSDGSTVALNAGSELTFGEKSGERRSRWLEKLFLK